MEIRTRLREGFDMDRRRNTTPATAISSTAHPALPPTRQQAHRRPSTIRGDHLSDRIFGLCAAGDEPYSLEMHSRHV
jgi:hypothetical protein